MAGGQTSVIIPNELLSQQPVFLIEMQKLAHVAPCVDFNGQAKELKCRFEQQGPAPVPDQIFKDFFTHKSTQNEYNLISKAF